MSVNYPYCELLRIIEECRNTFIQDTLLNNSSDLYDALYSDVNSEIFCIKMELYELLWIELHWKKIVDIIERYEMDSIDKKKLVSFFSEWYLNFISQWNFTELDFLVFEERKNILKALISANNEWDNNLKRMKVTFEQNKKSLTRKIKELERGI